MRNAAKPTEEAALAPERKLSDDAAARAADDFALTPQNTLTVRYDYFTIDERNDGVDTQALPSQAYEYSRYHHNLQIFDSRVLSPEVLNTTQFQYLHFRDVETSQEISPAIDVLGAFLGGGNAKGSLDRHETHYELQNYTTISLPNHLIELAVTYAPFVARRTTLKTSTARSPLTRQRECQSI
jgi:hypothetical protein